MRNLLMTLGLEHLLCAFTHCQEVGKCVPHMSSTFNLHLMLMACWVQHENYYSCPNTHTKSHMYQSILNETDNINIACLT